MMLTAFTSRLPHVQKSVFAISLGLIMLIAFLVVTNHGTAEPNNAGIVTTAHETNNVVKNTENTNNTQENTPANITSPSTNTRVNNIQKTITTDNPVNDKYSWLTVDENYELSRNATKALVDCLSHSQDPRSCVGITLATCQETPEQCAYAEAYSWDAIGEGAYTKLSLSERVGNAVRISQNAWKAYAYSECNVWYEIQDTILMRRNERARCALQLSSDRAITLRNHAYNLE